MLHLLTIVFIGFGDYLHAGIGDLTVAESCIATKLVVDAVAQRDIKVTLDVADVVEAVLARAQFYKYVLNAVFQCLAVGHKL